MQNASSSLNQLTDLVFAIFIAPGNFVATTIAGIAARFDDTYAGYASLASGGTLAYGIAAVFWVTVMVESCACSMAAQRLQRNMRRYRIMNACREAVGGPVVNADSTIVEELVALEDLAVAALRLARDKGDDGVATAEELRQLSGASVRDVRRVFKQLDYLQFIQREPGKASGNIYYSLTLTGGLYLRACEPYPAAEI
jgi:DNA-binding MarR family transcriptional regulator